MISSFFVAVAQIHRPPPHVPLLATLLLYSVVVMKRGNARGAKGKGHRRWIGSPDNGSSPIISGGRPPSRGGTGRTNREVHVRLRVQGCNRPRPPAPRSFDEGRRLAYIDCDRRAPRERSTSLCDTGVEGCGGGAVISLNCG